MEKLLKISKVAEILNVTTTTIRRWEKNNKIQSIRTCGNQRRFKITDIEKLFGECLEK